jgi:hypothetical protein
MKILQAAVDEVNEVHLKHYVKKALKVKRTYMHSIARYFIMAVVVSGPPHQPK